MRRAAAAAAMVVAVGATVAACGQEIDGMAIAEGAYTGNTERFSRVLEECDAVTEEQIAEAVGADAINKAFLGAICRWDASGVGGTIKVAFNWFETGTLGAEETTAQNLGYGIEAITIQGRRAIVMRPPTEPGACGVSLGSPSDGVVGWWVHYGAGGSDPCGAAIKLAELTVNLSA
ncbi:MAG: DUF3558 domain-containing protein [Rhodococcus sp.]|nr:DUF3558 domain-containing protein [Rhodococcus sp. (in: high G+C Gram-positive bacteria)]